MEPRPAEVYGRLWAMPFNIVVLPLRVVLVLCLGLV